MFNPSDLEGEVDHSFFDSDCDDSSLGRYGGKKIEKGLKAEKESPPAHEELHAKQTEITSGDLSLKTDGPKKQLKPVENNKSIGRAERKQNSCQLKEVERSRASSVSTVTCTSDNVINNCSDSEEDTNLQSKRPNGTFMTLLAESREVDYQDVYSQSPNESEEEALPPNAKRSGSKGRHKQSPKKRIRKRCTRSPSPTSTEASVDADSESSCGSRNGRSSLDSPAFPRSSLSTVMRSIRVGSTGSRDVPANQTEESDDTVTDVSPLSSPDCSPLQSLNLNHTEAEERSLKEQQQGSVPSSGPSNIHQDEDLHDDDDDDDECSLSSECQLGANLFRYPGGRNRKNYSFTNDEVRSIDRENQRLLRELSRLSPGPRPASTTGKKTRMASNSPHIRVSHSALNRQREQKRIERENLAFLKRLESVKPTPGLKRSEQLADYQRQVGYLGAPSYPICVSTTKKGISTSKTPLDGYRDLINRRRLSDCKKQLWMTETGPSSASSSHHSSRAGSTTTDSGHTPVPRSKKLSAARPAWC